MARGRSTDDSGMLEMALVGYQIEKQRIENQIREIQSQLKGRRVTFGGGGEAAAPRKRELSEAARGRIAAAQRKRWAEHRKRAAAAAKVKTAAS